MRLGKAIYIAGLIGFSAAGMALADDVTFAASGTFNDGATLGGTLVINTGTGVVESGGLDLTVVGGEAGPGLVFDTLTSPGSDVYSDGTDNLAEIDASDSADPGPHLQLEINIGSASSLIGFTGGPLCYVPAGFPVGFPSGDNCNSNYSSYQLFEESEQPASGASRPPPAELLGGSVGPATAPEPASLLLLAGPLALLIRRQLRKS
jgi:hypothetical protein